MLLCNRWCLTKWFLVYYPVIPLYHPAHPPSPGTSVNTQENQAMLIQKLIRCSANGSIKKRFGGIQMVLVAVDKQVFPRLCGELEIFLSMQARTEVRRWWVWFWSEGHRVQRM